MQRNPAMGESTWPIETLRQPPFELCKWSSTTVPSRSRCAAKVASMTVETRGVVGPNTTTAVKPAGHLHTRLPASTWKLIWLVYPGFRASPLYTHTSRHSIYQTARHPSLQTPKPSTEAPSSSHHCQTRCWPHLCWPRWQESQCGISCFSNAYQ